MAMTSDVEDAAARQAALDLRASFQENVSTIVRMLMASYGGINQTELAKGIGYTQPAVSDKLSHRRKWTVEDLWVLADFFDVDVALFFEDPKEILRTGSFSTLAGLPTNPAPERSSAPHHRHLRPVSQ